ncbi:Asp/Glu/Hydantoin racemase family protein [Candidatus Rhodobacter oscarellae]|uniref:Asp/Glu/Hydantoin racemase family protein n=1 Tax=Candidatus Rhodobacter oscarellae TaxID=1675527 RepID=A0A0J9E372_9RHOB|nr:aspartate/glutamate racemase family protein [Candidatus Rhodobacter lobularis]KMW57205.1 Asp/Glu/Hydantoin racemase family protein [Candidatus Rhodobacter lobularis]
MVAVQRFTARRADSPRPVMGVLLLSTDETLEEELRLTLPGRLGAAGSPKLHSARVISAPEVTEDSLAAMQATIPAGAAQLPAAPSYDVIGYGCTSATAVLGSKRVADLVRQGRACRAVTTPLDALVAWCAAHDVRRLAVLTPYSPEVSQRLVDAITQAGIEVVVLGAFDEPSEEAVVRISPDSVVAASAELMQGIEADALFLSCTNLPTLEARARLEQSCAVPVVSSNSVLAWDMCRLAGITL